MVQMIINIPSDTYFITVLIKIYVRICGLIVEVYSWRVGHTTIVVMLVPMFDTR